MIGWASQKIETNSVAITTAKMIKPPHLMDEDAIQPFT